MGYAWKLVKSTPLYVYRQQVHLNSRMTHSGAAKLSSEEKVKEILQQSKLDAGSSGSSSIKKQSYDPSQGGSPSERKNTIGQSDKLPSRNTLRLVDSPLGRNKSNQNPNIPGQGSPKSFQSSPNNTTSIGSIKTKVDNQGRNGQLSFPSNGTKSNESLGTGNNLVGRETSQSRSAASGSGGTDRRADVNNRNSTSSSNSSARTHRQTEENRKQRKPFGKLFEGVIFVMSGFANPYRKEVRDKAIEMGARYKGDWDSTCTHLICAFVNTPKFCDVRNTGRGHIVKKEWIERSYSAKCRFPWRRFCLDRNDRGEESEEEIYALKSGSGGEEEILEGPLGSSNDSYGNRRDDSRDVSKDVDGGVEHSDGGGEEAGEKEGSSRRQNRKRILVVDSSEDDEADSQAYDADTDVDEEHPPTNSSSVAKKSKSDVDPTEEEDLTTRRNNYDEAEVAEGADFFENSIFFLSLPKGDPLNQRSQIEQIISKRKGTIESELSEDVEYFITAEDDEWTEEFSEALSDNPNLSFVRFNWILECEKAKKMVTCDPFMITPS